MKNKKINLKKIGIIGMAAILTSTVSSSVIYLNKKEEQKKERILAGIHFVNIKNDKTLNDKKKLMNIINFINNTTNLNSFLKLDQKLSKNKEYSKIYFDYRNYLLSYSYMQIAFKNLKYLINANENLTKKQKEMLNKKIDKINSKYNLLFINNFTDEILKLKFYYNIYTNNGIKKYSSYNKKILQNFKKLDKYVNLNSTFVNIKNEILNKQNLLMSNFKNLLKDDLILFYYIPKNLLSKNKYISLNKYLDIMLNKNNYNMSEKKFNYDNLDSIINM